MFQFKAIQNVTYYGVFTPCENRNLETCPGDYATVDEAVFSPCRAEVYHAVTSRASPLITYPRLLCCQATAINPWMTQEWWSRDHVSSDVTRFNSDATIEAPFEGAFPRVSDQGFIGETEARLQAVLGSRQLRQVRSWRRSDHVN
jgi:hypothetical protein